MISVEDDEHIIFFGQLVGRCRENLGPQGAVFQAACDMSATPGGNLDHAITFRLGESLQRGVQSIQLDDIYFRKGIFPLTSLIQHFTVLVKCCDGHLLVLSM